MLGVTNVRTRRHWRAVSEFRSGPIELENMAKFSAGRDEVREQITGIC
jgi:hypothetical protein